MVVEGLMQGMHRSPMQGISVEFAQHRQYAPGDDTRFLDWKVFARTDKLYLKQYQKETNLDLLILLDVSGSMAYGSQGSGMATPRLSAPWRKFDHAACLAAAMSYLAIEQQDRVALSLFDTELRQATRLSNRQGHWRTIVEALGSAPISAASGPADADPPRTNLAAVFDAAAAKLAQRSLVVLVSDLFDDPAAVERGLARLHHRRHDVILMQVMDRAELDFPFRSPSEFVGLEADGRLQLDPAALRKAYLQAVQRHLGAIEEATRKFRFDYLLLNTAQPLGPALSHFLARRASQIAKG
jgi:uncharacterized protein (DUF58 family)